MKSNSETDDTDVTDAQRTANDLLPLVSVRVLFESVMSFARGQYEVVIHV